MNGAQALIKSLENEGVEVIFGYPGGAVLPIYDALIDSSIRHVLVRSEQGAAHAASGYARSTGKVGVCLATSGPGATNLITGIANAYLDSTPIVAITGQVDSRLIGQDVFQEVDIVGSTTPFTKNNYLLKNAKDITKTVAEAFHLASTGRNGPVLIDFPSDLQKKSDNYDFDCPVDIRGYKPNREPNYRQMGKVRDALRDCLRPLIYVGGGSMLSQASELILELAERIRAPIATTLPGIGSVPTAHDRCLGLMGQSGLFAANKAAASADLIIVLGTRLGDRATGIQARFDKEAKIIHIDIDPAEIGKTHMAFISIVGDLGITLRQLLASDIDRNDTVGWESEWQEWKNHSDETGAKADSGLDPKDIFSCLSQKADDNVLLTTDVGQNQIWAGRYFRTKSAGAFITSAGLGTMGFSIPSAIGAAIGRKSQRVITVVGDGGFQMCMAELATARQENMCLGIMLLNNRRLGMVRELQQNYCEKRYNQIDLIAVPDFEKIASAYGLEYIKVTAPAQIESAIASLLEREKFILVEFLIDPEANIIPVT